MALGRKDKANLLKRLSKRDVIKFQIDEVNDVIKLYQKQKVSLQQRLAATPN